MTEENLNFFTTLQSDYAAWLSQILLSALYDEESARKQITFPESLQAHIEQMKIPSRLVDSQGVLHELARKILGANGKPTKESMELFLVSFENFQMSLQKLEHGQLLADIGIDELTGMYTKDKMIPELERELERRARRGQPFCFVISRIDGTDATRNQENIILAAKAIQKTIRSFDDAYVSDEGEFISSLKHSDNNGGIKFVARLNHILKDNEAVKFTMSSLVAEPVPGDSIPQLIETVRRELKNLTNTEGGIAEQYEEISPLNQYLKSLKNKTE